MGHADHEISAAFSRFDRDGNQILDEDEQKRMKRELEEKRVCALHYYLQDKCDTFVPLSRVCMNECGQSCVLMIVITFVVRMLSALK